VRQLVIPRTGPPEVVRVREVPDPEPGPGQVRVRVRAAGMNFADVMARQGIYPDAPPLPAVMGYEVAGEVDRIGSDVTALAAGEA
jgi:NADPH:quinone reductase-like Zn-dependent oxidoreductase